MDGSNITPTGCVLTASDMGFIAADANDCGVQGPWYAYADGYADGASTVGNGKCQVAGHTECSTFTTPTPGLPFAPKPDGSMCATGHAAVVVPMTNPDYSNIYGAAIAVDLNNPGAGDSGVNSAIKPSYDPTSKTPAITGVAFDIDTPPTNAFRVELPTNAVAAVNGAGGTSNDAAWWGGGAQNASPVKAGHNSFKWADVGGPMYLTNPPAFDVKQVTSIKFHVVTNMNAAVDFSFCISNLTLTTN